LRLAFVAALVKEITTVKLSAVVHSEDWNEPSFEAESASEPALSGDSARGASQRDDTLTGRQLGLARDWSSSRGVSPRA